MGGIRTTTRIVKDLSHNTFAELKRRVGGDKQVVWVGVPAGKKEPDGADLCLIAAVQEFGSPERGIPERSFLRAGIRHGGKEFVQLNRINLIKIVQGNMTMAVALGQLGNVAVGAVRREIRYGQFEKLAESTIAGRRSRLSPGYRARLEKKVGHPLSLDTPLIDTGHLIQAITFVVAERK